MTLRQSVTNVVVSFCMCCVVAAGLTLVGCNSETIPPTSPEIRSVQQESAEKGVDQRAGKKSGPPISPRSVKGLIKKNAQP
jgi:hypothetical protein